MPLNPERNDQIEDKEGKVLRRIGFYFVFTLAIAAVTIGLIRVHATGGAQSYQPFTATFLETQPAVPGWPEWPPIVSILAVRQDGSQARVRKVIGARTFGNSIIIDVPSKTRISVDPATKSKTSYKISDRWMSEYLRSLTFVDIGTEEAVIEGHKAYKRVKTFGDVGVTEEEWLAPDLNYFPLRSIATTTKGGVHVQLTRQAISVALGTPDPNLFTIPTDYVERSPIQVFQEAERVTGRTHPALHSSVARQALEDAYSGWRASGGPTTSRQGRSR